MVFSVKHREANSQWSVYENQKTMTGRMEMPQAPMPTYLGPRSGSNSPRSISILSTNIDISTGKILPIHSTQVHPPAFSVVQDTITKQQHHKHMISNEMITKDIIGNDITGHNEKNLQYRQMGVGSNDVSWAKWVSMMIVGLVGVPIYFMLTFGFFDYGGYYEYSLDRTLNEKDTDIQLRYFLRYTRTQKVLSSVIGIIWILIVLAMIGVGFGLSVGK